MTPPARFSGTIAALSIAAALALPAAANAKAGDRNFQQTFPVASRLCAEIAQGVDHKRLRRFAARILADCGKLEVRFNAARAAVLAADASIASERANAHAATLPACAGTALHSDACREALHREHVMDIALNHQATHAARTYYRTVEAARLAFWHAIRALPGGQRLREDRPIPVKDD
jgi:hypothetical protein